LPEKRLQKIYLTDSVLTDEFTALSTVNNVKQKGKATRFGNLTFRRVTQSKFFGRVS
jgi:hypothetical protein